MTKSIFSSESSYESLKFTLIFIVAPFLFATMPGPSRYSANDMTTRRKGLTEMRETTSHLRKMVSNAKLMHEIPGFGIDKFFHDHFESAFNVKYLDKNIYENEDLKQRLSPSQYDPTKGEFYMSDKEYYGVTSELYAGYIISKLNDRRLYVKFAGKNFGFGVFANMDIPANTYLGDYTGIVNLDTPNKDYTWTHPYKFKQNEDDEGINLGVDSRHTGNMMRFVNAHINDDNLNCRVVYFVRDGEWSIAYYTTKRIRKDEQLIVSYGKAYWTSRNLYNPADPEGGPEKVEID